LPAESAIHGHPVMLLMRSGRSRSAQQRSNQGGLGGVESVEYAAMQELLA